jgi:hypothetical protein
VRSPSVSRPGRGVAVLLTAALLPACVGHRHTVGLGPTGAAVVTARQYYILFGLVGFNDVDSQRLANDLTSYSVETSYGAVDLLLAPFLLPLTATSRTVVVRT